jgi:hypothetical protein
MVVAMWPKRTNVWRKIASPDQALIAIENARLFSETQARKRWNGRPRRRLAREAMTGDLGSRTVPSSCDCNTVPTSLLRRRGVPCKNFRRWMGAELKGARHAYKVSWL